MFNKKEVTELKEELTSNLSNLRQEFSVKLDDNSNTIKKIHEVISQIKTENQETTENIKRDLLEINKIKSDFELSINRIDAIGRNIKESAALEVKEVANKEIESIKNSSKQYRDLEEELKLIRAKVSRLNMEMSKFLEISQQIKLVDFSLKTHQEEMSSSERERTNLRNENERLKSMMAKMKRNR